MSARGDEGGEGPHTEIELSDEQRRKLELLAQEGEEIDDAARKILRYTE